jgi:FMN phosphatase YigB (HAD superfamily)
MGERIEVVLLDAGGVIVDETEHERGIAELVTEILRERDPSYSLERYREAATEAVERFAPQVYRTVIWSATRPDVDAARAAFRDFRARWKASHPPLRLARGVGPELEWLASRHRVGLAGQYGAEILDLLDGAGLLGTLAGTLTQDDLDVTKPDPRFYERIAGAFGVDPRACVMVGDRIDKDVVPARMVGMRTIRIRTGLHRDQEPRADNETPDAELPSVVGLAGAVERLERDPPRRPARWWDA